MMEGLVVFEEARVVLGVSDAAGVLELGCTGSMMAMVLDFWEDALIRSMISRGRASLIL